MKVEKTVTITLEPEEKEIVQKFNMLMNSMCNNYDNCYICPIRKRCTQIREVLFYLKSL